MSRPSSCSGSSYVYYQEETHTYPMQDRRVSVLAGTSQWVDISSRTPSPTMSLGRSSSSSANERLAGLPSIYAPHPAISYETELTTSTPVDRQHRRDSTWSTLSAYPDTETAAFWEDPLPALSYSVGSRTDRGDLVSPELQQGAFPATPLPLPQTYQPPTASTAPPSISTVSIAVPRPYQAHGIPTQSQEVFGAPRPRSNYDPYDPSSRRPALRDTYHHQLDRPRNCSVPRTQPTIVYADEYHKEPPSPTLRRHTRSYSITQEYAYPNDGYLSP